MPRTSCRYWEKKNSSPLSAKIDTAFAATEPLNAGRAKRETSMSGCVSRRWRTTKARPAASPITAPSRTGVLGPSLTTVLTA